jgi:hypothetical protein
MHSSMSDVQLVHGPDDVLVGPSKHTGQGV